MLNSNKNCLCHLLRKLFFTLMISTVTIIKRTEENERRHAPTLAPAAPEEEVPTTTPPSTPAPRLVARRSWVRSKAHQNISYLYSFLCNGQKISEDFFFLSTIPPKNPENSFALASKKWSNQKNKSTCRQEKMLLRFPDL